MAKSSAWLKRVKVGDASRNVSRSKNVPKAEPVPAKAPDEVSESLAAIYQGRPTKEWMNTLDRGRRRTWIIALSLLGGLLAVSAAAAWAGFLWFGNRGFSGTGIEVGIEGPASVLVGGTATYFVNWYNVAKEPLAATEFHISFPNDFIVSDVSPTPLQAPSDTTGSPAPKTLTFRLGAQPTEARGSLKITGRFTGTVGTKSAIQVIGTYRPASYNSEFETLMSKDLSYAGSILSGSLAVPQKVVPGDPIVIRYHVENTAEDVMPGLAASFVLPDGFIPASGTPSGSDALHPAYVIGALGAHASTTIELRGAFALGAHGDLPIRALAGTGNPADDSFAIAQTSEGKISVLAGDLKINLVVNGSSDDRSADPGERERVSIAYANTSGETLKSVVLAFRLAGSAPSSTGEIEAADWNALDDPSKGVRKGNVITFTETEIPALKELAPDAQGTIDFAVPIKAALPSLKDFSVNMNVEARMASVGDVKVNRLVKTNPIAVRIRSDASVESVARYASEEGAQLGSGPLPPKAGTSTTYRVEWHLSKTLHELSRITVSATLPPTVVFGTVREVQAGTVGYDPEKKLVTWEVNRMPEEVKDLYGSFDVSITPAEADIGRFADLVGETRFEFTDAALSESVLRTAQPLTTELPDDPMAKKKGVVVK